MAITLGQRWDCLNGKPSGFDYMRIVLSGSVLVWHSYQVANGTEEALRFWRESSLGWLLPAILPIFFALSGFLVAGSMYRNTNIATFLALRVIRIFPALMVEVVLAALVLGPIVTTFPIYNYIHSPTFHHYFLNLFGDIHFLLPGVFENNPEAGIVNSQLWTVPFELECYLLISVLALIGVFRSDRLVIPSFLGATAVLFLWNFFRNIDPVPAGGVTGRLLVLCFVAGVVLYAHKDRIPFNGLLAAAAFVLAIVLVRHRYGSYVTPILFAYTTVYIGMLNPKRTFIVSSGDYSYGLYLYSCPIQQTVALALGANLTFSANVMMSLPIAILFSLFSWWCVEKPFLKVRRLISAKQAPAREPLPV